MDDLTARLGAWLCDFFAPLAQKRFWRRWWWFYVVDGLFIAGDIWWMVTR